MTPHCKSDVGASPGPTVAIAADGRAEEQRRVTALAQQNLSQLGMPRVNVLFIGADEVLWRLLATALELASPLASWRPGEAMHLPETGAVRTLVIRDVGEMSGAEQVRLLQWLTRAVGRTQVICTSRVPLLPLVDEGRFINALYYRLNTICVDLTAPAE